MTLYLQMTELNAERRVILCILLMIGASLPGSGQSAQPKGGSGSGNKATERLPDNLVARGKYIVEGLSRCGQCHTPREANGNPDRNQSLQGASVWLTSAEPVEDWPLQAPRIAGIPSGTDAEMIRLLTTGIWRDGKPLREPMPQFRMTQADAGAVVPYLKSLQ
jgi:mono/diheme cytochrome c family protein